MRFLLFFLSITFFVSCSEQEEVIPGNANATVDDIASRSNNAILDTAIYDLISITSLDNTSSITYKYYPHHGVFEGGVLPEDVIEHIEHIDTDGDGQPDDHRLTIRGSTESRRENESGGITKTCILDSDAICYTNERLVIPDGYVLIP